MFTTKDYGYLCLEMGNLDDPAYLHFVNNLEFNLTEKIERAAVALIGTTIQLWINPNYFGNISIKNQRGILQHELNHLVLGHLFVKNQDPKLMNIAMDLEINQSPFYSENDYLSLPEESCFYNKPPFDVLNLESKQTFWYYYDKLLENKDKLPKNLTEDFEFDIIITDDNGNPVDINSLSDEQLDQIKDSLKQRMNELMKDCPAGSIKNHFDYNLFYKITPPKVKWSSYLRKFATSVIDMNITFTRKKESKRDSSFPFGRKVQEKSKVLIGVDCSGSVDNDLLVSGFNEIYHLLKKGKIEFDVVQCDVELCSFEKYKGKWKGVLRKGNGGTDLTPIVDFYLKGKYDGLIVFTDGEFGVTERYNHPKVKKSIWIHYPNYTINSELPGIKINMN